MVAILASMWATATLQAIIPWFVFWPLFVLTQACIWTCVAIGLMRKLFGWLHFSLPESKTIWFNYNPQWEQYKKQHLR
jgi:hypothetical protein